MLTGGICLMIDTCNYFITLMFKFSDSFIHYLISQVISFFQLNYRSLFFLGLILLEFFQHKITVLVNRLIFHSRK